MPIIGLALWLTISSVNSNLPYTSSELILYFILAAYVGIVTEMWQAWFINERINDGSFSTMLLKPFPVFAKYMLENWGDKTFKITAFSLSLPIMYLIIPNTVWNQLDLSLLTILLFLLALIMGYLIMFFIELSIGFSSVWFYDISFLKSYNDLASTIFAGRFVPLIFFPGIIASVAIFLPFRYAISFPIEVLLNKLSFNQLILGFGIEIFWFILMFIVYKLIYRSFEKNYKGYGA